MGNLLKGDSSSKTTKHEQRLRLLAVVFKNIPDLEDDEPTSSYQSFITKVQKKAGAFTAYAAFFDFLEPKFGSDKSKTRRTFIEAINHVEVRAALTVPSQVGGMGPEAQHLLYLADLTEDSQNAGAVVPPGDFKPAWEALVRVLTRKGVSNWTDTFVKRFKTCNHEQKKSEDASTFHDRCFRKCHDEWKTSVLEELDGYLDAVTYVAGLDKFLLTELVERHSAVVPPDGIKTWDLSSIVKHCTLIELSAKFQQEAA